VKGDPVKVPRAFTARADRSCGRTAARSPRRRVFKTEARTCRHRAPAGRADAVPAIAPAAIVATTAATATSLSTTRSLDRSGVAEVLDRGPVAWGRVVSPEPHLGLHRHKWRARFSEGRSTRF
jgi:hypothetical protein